MLDKLGETLDRAKRRAHLMQGLAHPIAFAALPYVCELIADRSPQAAEMSGKSTALGKAWHCIETPFPGDPGNSIQHDPGPSYGPVLAQGCKSIGIDAILRPEDQARKQRLETQFRPVDPAFGVRGEIT